MPPSFRSCLRWSVGAALLLSACTNDAPQAGAFSGSFSPPHDADFGTDYSIGDGDAQEKPPFEERADVAVSPFIDAAKDPFSTFGADVDTASYDYFRQAMQSHALPAARYVRVEDFINYFDYSYEKPAADAAQPFTIELDAATHPVGRSSILLRVGIQAKAPPLQRSHANLVFLVDVSGSMASPNKLPYVKVLLKESLSHLQPSDTVSIVSYASDTRVRLAPTRVSERGAIEGVIDALEAGGSTHGESGIELAYEQAAAGFFEGGVNHVLLCTDGDFNLGVTSDDALVELIKQERETGVTLTALGFGSDNLNDSMMEKVSNAGNGIYSVIYSQDQAIEYANERLLNTMLHVAKDLKIQVEFNPAEVRAYRLLGYENRAIADEQFRDDTVDGGEIGANHRVTALYEVVPAGQPVLLPNQAPSLSDGVLSGLIPEVVAGELVRVKVRYKQPGATDADPALELVRSLRPDAIARDVASTHADLAWAAALAAFAERLRGSPFAEPDELERIAAIVESQKTRDSDRAEFAALFAAARPML